MKSRIWHGNCEDIHRFLSGLNIGVQCFNEIGKEMSVYSRHPGLRTVIHCEGNHTVLCIDAKWESHEQRSE
jgi:hypothetical protein